MSHPLPKTHLRVLSDRLKGSLAKQPFSGYQPGQIPKRWISLKDGNQILFKKWEKVGNTWQLQKEDELKAIYKDGKTGAEYDIAVPLDDLEDLSSLPALTEWASVYVAPDLHGNPTIHPNPHPYLPHVPYVPTPAEKASELSTIETTQTEDTLKKSIPFEKQKEVTNMIKKQLQVTNGTVQIYDQSGSLISSANSEQQALKQLVDAVKTHGQNVAIGDSFSVVSLATQPQTGLPTLKSKIIEVLVDNKLKTLSKHQLEYKLQNLVSDGFKDSDMESYAMDSFKESNRQGNPHLKSRIRSTQGLKKLQMEAKEILKGK